MNSNEIIRKVKNFDEVINFTKKFSVDYEEWNVN